jgi:uncharacterized protein (TIGR03000 family)
MYNAFYWNGYGTPYYSGWNYSNPYYSYPYANGTYYYQPWFGGGYYYPYAGNSYPNLGYYYSPGTYYSYSFTPGYAPSANTYAGTYSPPSTASGMPPYAQNAASSTYQSFYAGRGRGDDRAYVRVMVPTPDASVLIDNTPTQQKGFDRLFVTPTLEPNKKFKYSVKATWMENGREVARERTVEIMPGRESVVAFGGEREDLSPRTDPGFRRVEQQRPQESSTRIELGKVVSTSNGRLILTDMDGGNRRTFTIGPNTQIMMNGNTTELDRLPIGTRVQITLPAGSTDTATRIDAVPEKAAPEKVGDQSNVRERAPEPQPPKPPSNPPPTKDTTPRRESTPSTPR